MIISLHIIVVMIWYCLPTPPRSTAGSVAGRTFSASRPSLYEVCFQWFVWQTTPRPPDAAGRQVKYL